MEKKKALAYKKHLIEAQQAFIDIMEQKSAMPPAELKRLKRKYSPQAIEDSYQEFEDEARDNCDNYNNFDIICSYFKTTFNDIIRWESVNTELTDNIIKNEYEVEFLLKLNDQLNDNFLFINRIADPLDEDYADFTKDYYKRLTTIDTEDKDTTGIETPNPLFVFKNLKAEIDNPKLSPADKLEIVQQRLFDFLQWQKANDTHNPFAVSKDDQYIITARVYPKFEAMCRLEIERWKAILNISSKSEQTAKTGTATPRIRIASRHKLDVIKVFSAMYDLKWFTDGNHMPLTNKQQMMDALAEMLGDDFKSYSTNLSQAKDKSPEVFLKPFEELKKASRKYLDID